MHQQCEPAEPEPPCSDSGSHSADGRTARNRSTRQADVPDPAAAASAALAEGPAEAHGTEHSADKENALRTPGQACHFAATKGPAWGSAAQGAGEAAEGQRESPAGGHRSACHRRARCCGPDRRSDRARCSGDRRADGHAHCSDHAPRCDHALDHARARRSSRGPS